MVIKDEILKKQNEFDALCHRHKVKYLYAFGSSVTDRFDFNTSPENDEHPVASN